MLSVAFSPDGRQAVTGTGRNDRRLRSWDLGTGALRWKQPGHLDGITSISFSPDGRRLATAAAGMEMVTPMDMDPEVRIWDVESRHGDRGLPIALRVWAIPHLHNRVRARPG